MVLWTLKEQYTHGFIPGRLNYTKHLKQMPAESTTAVWITLSISEPKHACRIKEAAFRCADNPLAWLSDLLIKRAH